MQRPFDITIIDKDIRANVMRRMFPNGGQLTPEQRKEVFARYVESDAADARIMVQNVAALSLSKLGANPRWGVRRYAADRRNAKTILLAYFAE